MKLTCYSVFLFRDGWQQQQGGSWQSRDEAIKVVASECEADLEVFEIRETKVLIGLGRRPYHNPRGGYKHRYSSDEKDEPNTLFIDAVETEEIRRLCRDGEASYREDQAEIKKRIAKSRKPEQTRVQFDDLSADRKSRIRVAKSGCWIWRSSDHAPYRYIYADMKGAIPKGAHLRHVCHDRRCVNPNHLSFGTHLENMRDKVER